MAVGTVTIDSSYHLAGGQKYTASFESTAGTANGPLIVTSVADSSTDFNINYAVDVSTVKTFWIVSTQDVTVETNDGTTPADTIALKANIPYVWIASAPYDTFLLGTDVVSLKVTNASGSAAVVTSGHTYDETP